MGKRFVRGRVTLWSLGLPLGVAALFAGPSCSSTPPPADLSEGCSINSDCEGHLICAFGRCHEECKTSKDCNGATCLPPDDVCELPQETMCSGTLPCVTGLTCADNTCRAPCTPGTENGTSGGCLGTQTCTEISKEHVCVDSASDGGTSSKDGGRDSSSDGHGGTSDANGGTSDAQSDGSKREGGAGTDGSFMSNPTAGSLGFTVSNVDLGSVDAGALMGEPSSGRAPSDPDSGLWANAPDVTITGSQTFSAPTITITLMDGTSADLFVWNSLALPDTASLTFTDTNPVILAVLTTVSIQGTIYVNDGKPGGFSVSAPGPGAGQGGMGFTTTSGGGGGSFCGVGGQGGNTTPPVAAGGTTYGAAKLIPLIAGSNGGGAEGGSGGGAIQIAAGTSITVGPVGRIHAGGQGGNGGGNGGAASGGGSGGAILLEAPTVVIAGTLAANGGGGGGQEASLGIFPETTGVDGNQSDQPALGGVGTPVDGGTTVSVGGAGSAATTLNGGNGVPGSGGESGGGGGGGAGRIRINTASGDANIMMGSTISPPKGTACMTQGTLSP